MSEVIECKLHLGEMKSFSYEYSHSTAGHWTAWGSDGNNNTSKIIQFKSKINQGTFENFYGKGSPKFKERNLEVVWIMEALRGSELEIVDLLFTLQKHRIYDIGLFLDITRKTRIDLILGN
jgi:hypothetical protein